MLVYILTMKQLYIYMRGNDYNWLLTSTCPLNSFAFNLSLSACVVLLYSLLLLLSHCFHCFAMFTCHFCLFWDWGLNLFDKIASASHACGKKGCMGVVPRGDILIR